MKRPTIALACIMKNEEKNLPILLASVAGCFDEIHITDTGSTDRSVEIAKELGATVHHFEWCQNFAAARNASFEPIKTDYIAWLDLDDCLKDPDRFIEWRDTVMETADYWMATYHYSSNEKDEPTCSFLRERVFRRLAGFKWKYPVHEGMVPIDPKKPVKANMTSAWSVRHRRTSEDLAKDKGRNLAIFEANREKLDVRMQYYWGKELFENQRSREAIPHLLEALSSPELEMHDRLLGLQYCSYSLLMEKDFERAIDLSMKGTHLAPHRAEFWVLIADTYIQKGLISEAIPFYQAAKSCLFNDSAKTGFSGALFLFKDHYTWYPRNNLARIWVQMGDIPKALQEAQECYDLYGHPETKEMLTELIRIQSTTVAAAVAQDCEDIVFSCHQQTFYEWDWGIYKSKGVGGSETAVCEMAKHLYDLSGRKVKIFSNVSNKRDFYGVEYIPAHEMGDYLATHKPYAHIAWRHNKKITNAPTYLWCHDLVTPGAEHTHYTKLLALSPFHRSYIRAIQNVPKEKIRITRNGVDPSRFAIREPRMKVGNRVVYRSSPDRGLVQTILVMDKVREQVPDAELHVFYGFDNMYKNNAGAQADEMKKMVRERPWITYHGNVEQNKLSQECGNAKVWLYPTNFLETSCIGAMESLCEGVYPVVRAYGALKDTLRVAHEKGMCTMLDRDCETEQEIQDYASATVVALKEDYWKKVQVDPETFSWRQVAHEWLEWMKEDRG